MKKTTIQITGMHCASCAGIINKALDKTKGVKDANVNFSTSKASVGFDEVQVSEKKLMEVIEGKGFGASVAEMNVDKQEKQEKEAIKNLEIYL